ncbi:hypothetical protein [Azohydromonas sediminis]|uniref:hypothetical protein n=1 Tax=Azohydromonas sediminis TaxID=2259674 RepID=UPI000E651B1C|nr:hypothetical protein [Azohydromonas sediminis]
MRRRDWILGLAALALGHRVAASPPELATADGRWRGEVHDDGRTLVLRDADGTVRRRLPALSLDGARRGTITAIADLPRRRSVAVGFDGLDELWEVSLDPAAPPIFDGLVHDYRMGEAIATPGFLAPRRIPLAGRVLALREGAQAPQLLALLGGDAPALHLVNLDVRRSLSRVPVPPGADLRAARWDDAGAATPRLRVPAGDGASVSTIEVGTTTLRVLAP